jgi:hypothetical protein
VPLVCAGHLERRLDALLREQVDTKPERVPLCGASRRTSLLDIRTGRALKCGLTVGRSVAHGATVAT